MSDLFDRNNRFGGSTSLFDQRSDVFGRPLFDEEVRPMAGRGGDRVRRLEREISMAESQARSYGIKVPGEKKKVRLWDLLEWTRYPITNMIYTAVKEAKEDKLNYQDIGKILKSAWYGITLKQRQNSEDWLKLLFPEAPQWVLTVAGLAGDIVTDPATWLSFGMTGGVKGATEAAEAGAKYGQKLVRKIAKEGATSAFTKKLIEKFGGNTWQEAVQLAQRALARSTGKYGLQLGIPFTKLSTPLVAGGPLEWAAKGARNLGAENVAKALQRAPVAIKQLPGISGIRKAFSTSAKWGHFPEVHDIERATTRAASYAVETTMDNFRTITKSIQEVLDNPSAAVARVSAGKKGAKSVDDVLEFMWRQNEAVTAGRAAYGMPASAVHARRLSGFKKPPRVVAPLPEELLDVDNKLRAMLDDIWEGFEARGMLKEGKYLESYYPRFAKDATGNIAVVTQRKLTADAPFFHVRRFATREQAKAAGFNLLKPSESLKAYAHRAARAIQNHDMVEQIVKQYGVTGKGVGKGFEKVLIPEFKKYRLPPDIAHVVNQTQKILLDPDEASKALRYANKIQNWWRQWATVMNPGFHARNAMSNLWTGAYKDGIGPRQLANQLRAINIHAWKNNPEKMIAVTIDGKRVKKTAAELYEMMRKAGVHTGGFEAAELLQPIAEKVRKLPARMGSAAGSAVENTARVASALNDMEKGLSVAQAAKRVNHFFLDYTDLTDVEAKVRKLVPFYSWLKKNLSVQIHEFLTNPGEYTIFTTKPLRALDKLPGEEAQYLPDWMQQDLYINPMGAKGAYGNPLMLNPNLPFQDLGKLGVSPVQTAMESLTPFVKVPFELGLNVSSFTGKPLQYNQFDYRPAPPAIRLAVSALPPQIQQRLGIITNEAGEMVMPGKWVHALSSLLPMLKTGGGLERYVQAMGGGGLPEYRAERAPWDLLSRTAGVKFRPYDVQYYKEKALEERLKQLKGLRNLTEARIP